MGCSSSRHAQGEQALRHPRPALSERDAWRIALTWRNELRGCVRLEFSPEEVSTSFIPVYEWISFVFNGTLEQGFLEIEDPAKTAAYARAATTAWFALSCCKGYSGTENPQFWKRVFFELLRPKLYKRSTTLSVPTQIEMTDEIRFFTHADRPFPRVKLAIGDYDGESTIESVFLGQVPHENKKRDTKLRRILAKLAPCIDARELTRRVPVAVDFSMPRIAHPASLKRSLPNRSDMKPNPVVSVDSLFDFPQLDFRFVTLFDSNGLYGRILASIRPPSGVEICIGGNVSSFMAKRQLHQGLLNQLQSTQSEQELSTLRVAWVSIVQLGDLSYSYLSVVCSALPHLHCFRTVRLEAKYMRRTAASIASDWAWLGYAIFHPDTREHSGWTRLEVKVDEITPADVATLAKMARGNNLRGNTNTGFLEGRVRCGTELKADPVNNHEATMHTFSAEAWVSICLPGAETPSSPDWVCVVVPGFRYGWVRQLDLIETRCRAPGDSCIRELRIDGDWEETQMDVLEGLLRILGDRLNGLFFYFRKNVSASTVQAILRLCPNLKRLLINHDGSFWSDDANAMELPRLQELWLKVQGGWGAQSLCELKLACLPHLKTLRVSSYCLKPFKEYEDIFTPFLSSQHVLQYFCWSDLYRMHLNTPSIRKADATRKRLSQVPANCQHWLGPLRLDCRLAFLSVVRDESSRSFVGRLGQDVISLIFEYATSPFKRDIIIKP